MQLFLGSSCNVFSANKETLRDDPIKQLRRRQKHSRPISFTPTKIFLMAKLKVVYAKKKKKNPYKYT